MRREWYYARIIAAIKNAFGSGTPANWQDELIQLIDEPDQDLEEALAIFERIEADLE